MGTKLKPGRFDCYKNAKPDEPIFVLLARDKSAPEVVRYWARLRSNLIDAGMVSTSDRAMIKEALACARTMEKWRRDTKREES